MGAGPQFSISSAAFKRLLTYLLSYFMRYVTYYASSLHSVTGSLLGVSLFDHDIMHRRFIP